jgi:prepilin-type N-terminal cleavage/methylation domain-containing protein
MGAVPGDPFAANAAGGSRLGFTLTELLIAAALSLADQPVAVTLAATRAALAAV